MIVEDPIPPYRCYGTPPVRSRERAGHVVREPGDLLALPGSGGALDERAVTRAVHAGMAGARAHDVPLMKVREAHLHRAPLRLATVLAVTSPRTMSCSNAASVWAAADMAERACVTVTASCDWRRASRLPCAVRRVGRARLSADRAQGRVGDLLLVRDPIAEGQRQKAGRDAVPAAPNSSTPIAMPSRSRSTMTRGSSSTLASTDTSGARTGTARRLTGRRWTRGSCAGA